MQKYDVIAKLLKSCFSIFQYDSFNLKKQRFTDTKQVINFYSINYVLTKNHSIIV